MAPGLHKTLLSCRVVFLTILFAAAVTATTSKPQHIYCNELPKPPCVKADEQIIDFGPLKHDQTYLLGPYLKKAVPPWALGAYVALAREFIVGITQIPFDVLRDIFQMKFQPMELLQKSMGFELPIMITGAIGLLFAIFMPIVGFFFCCCRLCGKCGGRLTTAKASRQNRKLGICHWVFLLITVLFLVVGTGGIYTVGGRLGFSFTLIKTTVSYIIKDVLSFFEQLFQELNHVVDKDMQFALDVILHDLSHAGKLITKPFLDGIRPDFTAVLNSLVTMEGTITAMSAGLTAITVTEGYLRGNNTLLQTGLTEVRNEMTAIKTDCPGLGVPAATCDQLPDVSLVPTAYDFSQTPSLSDQTSFLSDASAINLKGIISTANDTFEGIPGLVDTAAKGTSDSVESALNGVTDAVKPIIATAKQTVDGGTHTLEGIDQQIIDMAAPFEAYLAYMAKGFLGVTCQVLMVIGTALIGLLWAVCGFPRNPNPAERSSTAHCAARWLMTTTAFAFMFAFQFWLTGTILYLLGAHLTLFCKPIQDLTIFDNLLDDPAFWKGEYPLGKILFQDGQVPLTMKSVLVGCRQDKAAYTVLELNRILDISEQVDIQSKIPDMTALFDKAKQSVKGVNIMSTSYKSDLDGLTGSVAANMDISSMLSGLTSGISNLNLKPLSDALYAQADSLKPISQPLSSRYLVIADKVSNLQKTTVTNIQTSINLLQSQLEALSGQVSTVVTSVSAALDKVDKVQQYLDGPGADVLVSAVQAYLDRVVGWAIQLVAHVDKRLSEDMGKCRTVWNIWEGVTFSICGYFADALNGLWLSLLIVAICFVPNCTFAVRLSKYLRRPVDYDRYRRDQNLVRPMQEVRMVIDQQARDTVNQQVRPSQMKKYAPQ